MRSLHLALALLALGCARTPSVPAPTFAGEHPDVLHLDASAGDTNARDASTPETPSEIRYLSLGDSFTIGTGSTPEEAFPARLVARWTGRCAVTLRNPAVNGFSTQELLDVELPVVQGFAPTFVTLAVGANDIVRGRSLDAYRAQVQRIFEELARAGVPASRVVALPQPDWSLSPTGRHFGPQTVIHDQIVAFNAALREVSTGLGARYIDLFPLMEAQGRAAMFAPDGLHPSAAAHDGWAESLTDALRDVCDTR